MKEKKLSYKEADNGKYGYVDENDNWVIEPKFDDAWSFEDGIAKVKLDGKYGYVDENDNWVIEPKFDDAWSFKDGIAKVKLDGKYGFIKPDGTYLVEPKFDSAESFEDGIAKVKLDGKYGFIKPDGTYLVEPKFDDAEDFEDGEAMVLLNNMYHILLPDGTLKPMSKEESYVLSCREIQNWGSGGWSFLEASNKDGKWIFNSWSRNMNDSDSWYEAKEEGIYEDEEVARYYDEVEYNKEFADWANALNLSTPEEVGKLLWANAQQLIENVKHYEDDEHYDQKIFTLTLLILLYNQLENINSLGLNEIRKNLKLPKEKDFYLNPEKIKKTGVKLCAYLVSGENGFEYLDFTELLALSRTPGDHRYISEYDFEILEDEEEWDVDEEEDEEEDED